MTRDNRSHGRTGRGGRGCGTMASASALPLMRQAHVARANTPRRRTARRGRPPRAAGQRGRQARALSPPLASHTHTHTHTVPYLVQHREHLAQLLHLPLMLPCRLLRRLLALAPPKRQDDPHRSPRHVPPAYRPRLPPPSPSPPRDVFIVAALWATATTKNKGCPEFVQRGRVTNSCPVPLHEHKFALQSPARHRAWRHRQAGDGGNRTARTRCATSRCNGQPAFPGACRRC